MIRINSKLCVKSLKRAPKILKQSRYYDDQHSICLRFRLLTELALYLWISWPVVINTAETSGEGKKNLLGQSSINLAASIITVFMSLVETNTVFFFLVSFTITFHFTVMCFPFTCRYHSLFFHACDPLFWYHSFLYGLPRGRGQTQLCKQRDTGVFWPKWRCTEQKTNIS